MTSQISASIGSIKVEFEIQKKKPKILCLHGYRTSADILRKQIGKWPEIVLSRLDLEFIDGPLLARGESGLERLYTPPYYEWFYSKEDFSAYHNFEESVAYVEDYMMNHGPFDGLLGFSQGAILSAALTGLQLRGIALTKVPKIRFVIIMSGMMPAGLKKFGQPKLAGNAYSSVINCPSLHIIGEGDLFEERGFALLESFENPYVIHHSEGHKVPRLDGKGLETMLDFIEKIEKLLLQENRISSSL